MSKIIYTTGDITDPLLTEERGGNCIVQVVNNINVYGAGVSGAIARKWPVVEQRYRAMPESNKLGISEFIRINPNLFIVNMCAQNGVRFKSSEKKPLRYGYLALCLTTISTCSPRFSRVHMPKIGCGLAGGNWDIVSEIVEDILCGKGIEVYVYVKD